MSDDIKMEDDHSPQSNQSLNQSIAMELPPAEATFGSILPFNLQSINQPINTLNSSSNQSNQSTNPSINSHNSSALSNSVAQPPSQSINQPVNLSTIAQLIDDLRSSDLSTRLQSFQSINQISSAIGPLRTREELIPYLSEFIDDDDEVLLVLAQRLIDFINLVGGVPFAHVILAPLESLLSCEETQVRNQSINSILFIADQMTDIQVENYLVPMIRKLSSDTFFTAKMSAAFLFDSVYKKVINAEKQKELRSIFLRLCQDETPMVKRAACENFGKAVDAVASTNQSINQSVTQSGSPSNSSSPSSTNQSINQQIIKSEFFPIYLKLVKDDQDSVRLLTVDAAINLSINQSVADQITKMLPVIFQLCADKSWRVRYMAAMKFVDIVKAMSQSKQPINQSSNHSINQSTPPQLSDELIDSFVRLLSDDEAEVRTIACQKLGDLSGLIGPVFTTRKLLNPCKSLVRDPSHFVRAAFAGVLVQVAHTLNQTTPTSINQSINQSNANGQTNNPNGASVLLPLFLQLLRDQHSEVRLQLISKMDQSINQSFNQSINQSEQLHSALLPAIRELAADPKWRVRLEIINQLPKLATQFGSTFFDTSIRDLALSWCGDSVFSIRSAATLNLTLCVTQFGEQWANQSIIPRILLLSEHTSYLYRLTCCNALKGMMKHLTIQSINQKQTINQSLTVTNNTNTNNQSLNQSTNQSIWSVLLKLCNDPVPNVRFAACKALEEIALPVCNQSINQSKECVQELINQLTKMELDTDMDVKYYAKRAREAWTK